MWIADAESTDLEREKKTIGEDVIVVRRSDRELEVHCHGGQFAKRRIIAALQRQGFQQIAWRELKPPGPRSSPSQMAGRLLPLTTTIKTAAVLNWQASGAMERAVATIAMKIRKGDLSGSLEAIDALMYWRELGRHLTQPWRVAVAGLPNVGKSSLINRMLGFQRSIVFDQPGTTRDLVATATAINGWPVELIDTAGLRQGAQEIETAGIELARRAVAKADLVVEVHDATNPSDGGEPMMSTGTESIRYLPVVNKSDLKECPVVGRKVWLRVSALTGMGVDELMTQIATRILPRDPEMGQAVPFTEELISALDQAASQLRAGQTDMAIKSLEKTQEWDSAST
jgi:tRNA modification GTPase